MWGKSTCRISEYVGEWAGRWGEAGEDLSILDISPAYLNCTLPESYKQQGLWMICAVPDGKDFMCFVPRSNTMLTRASHSDKVGDCWRFFVSGAVNNHRDLFLCVGEALSFPCDFLVHAGRADVRAHGFIFRAGI